MQNSTLNYILEFLIILEKHFTIYVKLSSIFFILLILYIKLIKRNKKTGIIKKRR